MSLACSKSDSVISIPIIEAPSELSALDAELLASAIHTHRETGARGIEILLPSNFIPSIGQLGHLRDAISAAVQERLEVVITTTQPLLSALHRSGFHLVASLHPIETSHT